MVNLELITTPRTFMVATLSACSIVDGRLNVHVSVNRGAPSADSFSLLCLVSTN